MTKHSSDGGTGRGIAVRILAVVVALAIAAPAAAAGKLDLPAEPNPTRVLSRAIVWPGAGWLYMGQSPGGSRSDYWRGFFTLALTVGAAVFGANGAKHGRPEQLGAGVGGVFVIRFVDITDSTDAAVRRSALNASTSEAEHRQ